jgi:hypothetical protein
MNFKQFLKPDGRKIGLFISIFVLLIFIPFFCISIPAPTAIGVKGFSITDCSSFYSNFIVKLGWIIEYDNTCLNCPSLSSFLFFLIVYLLISYILSCLIVWIYDKMKKKK